ncbi:MAG: zinc ribbon domain-containing protein [Coriobacteriales bacterium]|nr:zinc ribbon domain-containing protein [Coriobacteriales bacterium]
MPYCDKCGAQVRVGERFCNVCGAPVQAATQRAGTAAVQAAKQAAGVNAPAAKGEFVVGSWRPPARVAMPQAQPRVAMPQQRTAATQQRTAAQPQANMQGVRWASNTPQSKGQPLQQKKKGCIPKLLGLLLLAALIVGVVVYVLPMINEPNDPGNGGNTVTNSTPGGNEGGSVTPGNSGSGGNTVSPGFSTTERPTLADFDWLDGEVAKGNMPVGVTPITNLGDVTGGWKAYLFGNGIEQLMNVDIQVGQSDVVMTFDWYYSRYDGDAHEDDTPDSTFTGSWDDGWLDAVGPGRVTIVAFWEQDGVQYATGSFLWPDGGTGTILMVRP